MKKYITAYISFFDNNMQMGFVFADNEVDALIKLMIKIWNNHELEQDIEYLEELYKMTPEEIKQEFFNNDSMAGVYCIS